MTKPADRPAASVTVYPDGPLVVRGDVEIRDLDGTVVETAHTIALCRCGRSARKPLCDGSHQRGALGPRRA
jgi:CDGSH-type Zn-finger protein